VVETNKDIKDREAFGASVGKRVYLVETRDMGVRRSLWRLWFRLWLCWLGGVWNKNFTKSS